MPIEITAEESIQAARSLFEPILEAEGITVKYLAKRLKRELNAKETKIFNGGAVGLIYSKPLIAWDVRQRARMDAHKLRGDYPATEINAKIDHGLKNLTDEQLEALIAKLSARD